MLLHESMMLEVHDAQEMVHVRYTIICDNCFGAPPKPFVPKYLSNHIETILFDIRGFEITLDNFLRGS